METLFTRQKGGKNGPVLAVLCGSFMLSFDHTFFLGRGCLLIKCFALGINVFSFFMSTQV